MSARAPSPRDPERRAVMSPDGRTCTFCGWVEEQANNPALHREHVAHLLQQQPTTTPSRSPAFDRTVYDAAFAHPPAPRAVRAAMGTVEVWLAADPLTGRITWQTREPTPGDLPPGERGQGWVWRKTEVDAADVDALLRGGAPEEQDAIRARWWEAAS